MRRAMFLFLAVCLALATAAPAGAAGPMGTGTPIATWTQAPAGPQVYWGGTTFAPSTCQLVSFGGGWVTEGAKADTFLFDPARGTWATIAGRRTGPSARAFPGLAWDPGRSRVVMFGGRTNQGISLQDTWAFDPAARTWSPLVSDCRNGNCPPARWGHGVLWSRVLGKVVLFGGTSDVWSRKGYSGPVFFGDLWAFGTSWSQLRPAGSGPSPRFLFGMAEDQASGLIVLYGGAGQPAYTSFNDTWLLDPRAMTWTRVATATTPPAYAEVSMGWSPSLGAVVMTGGSDARAGTVADPGTWAFDMTARNWVRVSTAGGPPSPRKNASLTADSCHGSAILFGGVSDPLPPTFDDRTWILR